MICRAPRLRVYYLLRGRWRMWSGTRSRRRTGGSDLSEGRRRLMDDLAAYLA